MTQEQMIESVQQLFPNLGETQIRIWLNLGLKQFCRKTRILKANFSFNTAANKRYYSLGTDVDSTGTIIEVLDVNYDNYQIPRLVGGKPDLEDLT
jgi:hypothetical protein